MELLDICNFDKNLLKINIPAYNGETQYSKLTYNGAPIIIQTPTSLTRQGIIKQGKRLVCELMFDSIETEFLHWIEELESGLHDMLFKKSNDWFEQSFELNEIESLFNSPVKIFKSGKYYLLKGNVKDSVKIFNDNHSKGLTYMDIIPENNIISILEIKGIKYTSRDFQLDIEIKQMMVIQNDPYENNCFIKRKIESKESHLGKKIGETFKVEEIINKPNTIDTTLKELTFEDIENSAKIPNEGMDLYKEAKKELMEANELAKKAQLRLEEIKKIYNIYSDSE
jgi:hypothetical protein